MKVPWTQREAAVSPSLSLPPSLSLLPVSLPSGHLCPWVSPSDVSNASLPVAYYYGKRKKIVKPPIGESMVESGHPKPARRRKRRKSIFVQKKRRSSTVDFVAGSGEVGSPSKLQPLMGKQGPGFEPRPRLKFEPEGLDSELPRPLLVCGTLSVAASLASKGLQLAPRLGSWPLWADLTKGFPRAPGREGTGPCVPAHPRSS